MVDKVRPLAYPINTIYPLFRVMEIQRICEVTATPFQEGANLSEQSSNKWKSPNRESAFVADSFLYFACPMGQRKGG